MTALRPDIIRQSIANLFLQYPELESDERLRADMVEGCTDAHAFLELCVKQIGETNALSAGIDGYLKELCDRQARYSRRVEALRLLAFKIMSAADLRKVELPIATLSIKNGSQKLIGDAHPDSLPDNLVRIKRELDKTKIKEALEAGEEVQGFQLSNGEQQLSIRTK